MNSGHHEQDDRDGHLSTDEQRAAPSPCAVRSLRRRSPSSPTVKSARVDRIAGTNPNSTALDERHKEAEHQCAPIESEAEGNWQISRDRHLSEQHHSRVSDAKTDHAAEHCEHDAFGDQLPNHPWTTRRRLPAAARSRETAPERDWSSSPATLAQATNSTAASEGDQHQQEHHARRVCRHPGLQLGSHRRLFDSGSCPDTLVPGPWR